MTILVFAVALLIGFIRQAVKEYETFKALDQKMKREEEIRNKVYNLRQVYRDEMVTWRPELNKIQIGTKYVGL